jgi:plasmid stability protein
MSVNLSIKNVPDHLAEQLRKRAARHHRSLQGELMAILEENLGNRRSLMPAELLSKIRASGLKTPEEAARLIRRERDERSRR